MERSLGWGDLVVVDAGATGFGEGELLWLAAVKLALEDVKLSVVSGESSRTKEDSDSLQQTDRQVEVKLPQEGNLSIHSNYQQTRWCFQAEMVRNILT